MPYLKLPTDILSLPIIHINEDYYGWTDYEGGIGEISIAKQVTPNKVIWWKPVNYRNSVRRIRAAAPAEE